MPSAALSASAESAYESFIDTSAAELVFPAVGFILDVSSAENEEEFKSSSLRLSLCKDANDELASDVAPNTHTMSAARSTTLEKMKARCILLKVWT